MKNENKDQINSHIYVPKSILNRFATIDEKNRKIIQYIDLEDMQVKKAKTSSFNTQLGYYSKENEEILSREAESKIGNVIKKIENINDREKLNKKDIESMYRYLAYQILRTDYFSYELNNRFKTNWENEFIKNELIKEENELDIVYNVIRNEDIYVIINKSETKFVLPINTMYTFNPDSNEYIWMLILSLNIAISFMSENTIKKISNGKDKSKIKIIEFRKEQEDIIKGFNIRSIGTQYKGYSKLKCVIGLENELNYLVEIINKNKE